MLSGHRKSHGPGAHMETFLSLGSNPSSPTRSDPRLSPRVMVDVDLSFVKPNGSDTATVVNHFLRSRTPTPALLVPDLDIPNETEEILNKKAQLNAYIAWVNSQLKKKQGTRLVEDLRVDMRDGTILLQLIEIVGGEKLTGVHEDPSGYAEMKENVERVLQFMCKTRIRMHHTNAADIVDGNLKAIMRLILALAAHYKPSSVKHSAYQHYKSPAKGNIAGIAQGASAALADARRHAARAGHRYRRSRDAAINERRKRVSPEYSELTSKTYQESSSDQFSESDDCYRPTGRTRTRHSRRDVEGSSSSPTTSIYGSPRGSGTLDKLKGTSRDSLISRSKSSEYGTAKDSGAEFEDTMTMVDKNQYQEMLNEYDELATAMKDTRQQLSRLQDVLLSGLTSNSEEPTSDVFEGSSPEERLAVFRSRLLQQSELSEDLRDELSKSKNECLQLQGTKAGLQHRLCEQNITLSALKSDLLQKDFERQNLEAEKSSLLKQMKEKDKLISDLRKDILKRDNKIDSLQHDLLLQIQEKESTTTNLKSQIQDLHKKLRAVGETGATLSARVATQDKRMAKLADKIFQPHPENGSPSQHFQSGPEELQSVRESLQNLRLQYQPTDPQLKSVDTVEHSIAALLEHMYSFSNCTTPVNRSSVSSVESSPKRGNYDKAGELRRFSNSSALGVSMNPVDGLIVGQNLSTKVLYFTDRMVTPFMCTIHKKLGDITLKDFKELFEKPNLYRYHFKALDPEYGTVKEEISNDETVIPGWEGKIVAWVEEEQSTAC